MDLRLQFAVAAAKATGAASRRLKRGGGTTFPGDVARALDPKVLAKLTHELSGGVILVTGTNGKTTTTGMIAATLTQAGKRVLTNASGANLIYGLTAAAIADSSFSAKLQADIAVLEVDELVLLRAAQETLPRMVVVLNFMRDQLDRSGELQTTAARVGDALAQLPLEAKVVINADDPLVYSQGELVPNLVTVGINAKQYELPELPHSADARNCPHCESALEFSQIILGHCGKYLCPKGDFAHPQLDYAVEKILAPALDRLQIAISEPAGTTQISTAHAGAKKKNSLPARMSLAVGGLYNAYNAVAAYAACRELGLTRQQTIDGLTTFQAKFGRQEVINLFGRQLHMLLAKNPTGFDEVLRTADELGQIEDYIIAINDNIADGRDVSWLWDVDFERLAKSSLKPTIIASGKRARDLAVRLKYAGLDRTQVVVETEPKKALQQLAKQGVTQKPAVVICTYTAMLQFRAVAQEMQAVGAFWR